MDSAGPSQTRELMPMPGNLSIGRMCQLAQVSRVGFYRPPLNKRNSTRKLAEPRGRCGPARQRDRASQINNTRSQSFVFSGTGQYTEGRMIRS